LKDESSVHIKFFLKTAFPKGRSFNGISGLGSLGVENSTGCW